MSLEIGNRRRTSHRAGAMAKALAPKRWVRTCAWTLLLTLAAPALGEDIAAVLERSHSVRLASFAAATTDGSRAIIVRQSFDALVRQLQPQARLQLHVASGSVVAECLLGYVIVVNESLADLQEPVRLFLLAHELGHATLGHWRQMSQLYSKYMPGQIGQATAASADERFLAEASQLSRAHELAADAFAYELLKSLGYGFRDVVGALTAFGMQRDSATHPGSGRRIAHLRSLG